MNNIDVVNSIFIFYIYIYFLSYSTVFKAQLNNCRFYFMALYE